MANPLHGEARFPANAERVVLDWKDVPRWSDVLARAGAERQNAPASTCDGEAPPLGACRMVVWERRLDALRGRPAFEQIAAVQAEVNRLPYVSDRDNWGMADRWATPEEMFARGGDCEDYALTKYFALRDLGISATAMQLAIVWDRQDDEQHAILFVHDEGAVWMLDNKFAGPMRAQDFVERYRVIYAIGAEGAHLSPAALGTERREAPRLSRNGRMLVFRTRPTRRLRDEGTVQFAAASPPVAPAAPAPAVALAAVPGWTRAFTHTAVLRPIRYWFTEEPVPQTIPGLALRPFLVAGVRMPAGGVTASR